jgi:hypothetical protein
MKNSGSPVETQSSQLEFPDWRGMRDSGQTVDAATAFRLIDEYFQLLPHKDARWHQERLKRKCRVEFIL